MNGYSMTVEPGDKNRWSIKICDDKGNLYRYFASISENRELLLKLKEYFDMGDISYMHIDDIICDVIALSG